MHFVVSLLVLSSADNVRLHFEYKPGWKIAENTFGYSILRSLYLSHLFKATDSNFEVIWDITKAESQGNKLN
jgi:hypothetical protein